MDNSTIQKFLDEHDYDIRKTHNARWIDQKCTMDVVCLVSDCIVDAAVEAADMVFMTSSMRAVVEAMDIAKTTNRIAFQNVVFALGIKLMVMVFGLLGLANMWLAVFADTGVAMLCVLNSVRILRRK